MSNDFVPLLTTADLDSAAASPASSPGPSEAAFRPVLAGPVHCSASAPGGGATGPTPPAPASPPIVTLKREGDRVTHVQIQCSCGELIELNCVYGL